MKIQQVFPLSLLLLITSTALVASNHEDSNFYLRAETGPSFSMRSHIDAPAEFWDPAPEGYNGKLGTAFMAGFAFGYHINYLLSAGVSVYHRSKYKYDKQQSPAAGAPTPSFLGNKTRFFNLDNTSFMIDFFINRTNHCDSWTYECGSMTLIPYVGLGAGIAKNTVYNFHSVTQETLTEGSFTTNVVASILADNVINKACAKAEIGVDVTLCSLVNLGINYRFFYGGKFLSNNYRIDAARTGTLTAPIIVPEWQGKLKANELGFTFAINF